jgi:hypothetical protein
MNYHIVACCAYKAERHLACLIPSFLTLAFPSFLANLTLASLLPPCIPLPRNLLATLLPPIHRLTTMMGAILGQRALL